MNLCKSLLLQFLLLSTITGFSQKKNKTIKIIVLNEKNRPFENVTVELLSAKKITFIKAIKMVLLHSANLFPAIMFFVQKRLDTNPIRQLL